MKQCNFITNHGLVLLYIFRNPNSTMREMAAAINVTERTIKRILGDLETAGYISWQRTSKGNIYEFNSRRGLKHELIRDVVVGDLLDFLSGSMTLSSRRSPEEDEKPAITQ